MNILISGGMGFVGIHLSKYLIKQGHNITIFDNLSNSQLTSISGITFVKGNILDTELLFKSLNDIELVIHLAAQIDVSDSIRNPENTMKINVDGTKNLLNACVKKNIKNFIAISTAAVFGNQDELLDENSKTIPISPYGESKLLMEKIIDEYSKKHNINSIILRFFNLYGDGQSSQYAGVITKFLKRIRENQPLEIYGDGNQTRDFIHIDDAVKCIHQAILHLNGKIGKIYNVGSGKSVSILELAKMLIKISGKQLPIVFKPEIQGDILHSQTSINNVKNELHFKPQVLLQEGLSTFFKDAF